MHAELHHMSLVHDPTVAHGPATGNPTLCCGLSYHSCNVNLQLMNSVMDDIEWSKLFSILKLATLIFPSFFKGGVNVLSLYHLIAVVVMMIACTICACL